MMDTFPISFNNFIICCLNQFVHLFFLVSEGFDTSILPIPPTMKQTFQHLNVTVEFFWILFVDVLKEASVIYPALLQREVEAVRQKHRSFIYCDELLQCINMLQLSSEGQ